MGNDRLPESQHSVWRTVFHNVHKQVTLNLKQRSGLNSNTRYYVSYTYLQALYNSKLIWENYIFRPSRAVSNSIVSGGIRSKFKLIKSFKHDLQE